jgi:hypothetical protein
MPRLSVRLSDTALHQLEALAAERGCTVSDAIRIAIEQATAPHTLDTCARHVLRYMNTHTEGLEEVVATMASTCNRPVADMMSYLTYMGLCALEAGFAPMGDNALQAG